MNLLDYLIMLLYFAVMIGAGYWGLTRARSADDYLVAFVVVSLLTPKPSEESMAAWERRLTEGETTQVSEGA